MCPTPGIQRCICDGPEVLGSPVRSDCGSDHHGGVRGDSSPLQVQL